MVVMSTECLNSPKLAIFHRCELKSVKYCQLSIEYFTNRLLFPCHLLCKNSNLDIFINRQVVRSKIYLYTTHRIHGSFLKTRMHSSRMRTARSLPYMWGLCTGGSLSRVVFWGALCLEGLCQGVSVRETPLDRDPLAGQTDTCENITLPETSFASISPISCGHLL